MIEADKRALKATLTHGISAILGELVDLYSSTLGDLGVQCSVIAGLSFAGSVATNYPDSEHNLYIYSLSWFYYMILLVSFVSSVVSVVVATIASAFGPSLALTGNDSKTILYAIRQMQFMQEYVFVLGGISVVTMVASLAFYSFATFPLGPAIMTTVFCIVGTVLLIKRGLNTLQNVRQKGKKYLEQILASFQDESEDVIGSKESINKNHQYPNITYANSIWKRAEMHKGGDWSHLYGVLSKGGMDFYDSKDSYNNGSNRISRISLKYMKITTDPKYFNPDTPQISFKLFSQSYTKDRKLMFALLPLNEHEIVNSVEVVELQAVSFETFKEWMRALKSVEEFYSSFHGNALKSVLESK